MSIQTRDSVEIVPAEHYSFEELAQLYNATRVDYLVPLPMGASRLTEYARVYDVDLGASYVAVAREGPVGLGMLGVRPGRAWITRLGVLPAWRRFGVGRTLMDGLLAAAAARALPTVWLEVIKGNAPAARLFERYGFRQTRELLVVRRAPAARRAGPGEPGVDASSSWLDRDEALRLLSERKLRPNWLNESASMRHVVELGAVRVRGHAGGEAWATFDIGPWQLTRIVVEVVAGDPADMAAAVLTAVHERYPRHDTFSENLAADDPMWPGFRRCGYFDAFRRLEMVRQQEVLLDAN